jgi:hypothetical protein
VKIGDLVKYHSLQDCHSGWLGIIVGDSISTFIGERKVVQWTSGNQRDKDRGTYHVRDLVLVNENR